MSYRWGVYLRMAEGLPDLPAGVLEGMKATVALLKAGDEPHEDDTYGWAAYHMATAAEAISDVDAQPTFNGARQWAWACNVAFVAWIKVEHLRWWSNHPEITPPLPSGEVSDNLTQALKEDGEG